MAYPTLEQYNQALQHPARAFTDPELQRGQVRTTGLGLPFAVCGGFALTYEITSGGRKYAVRCFHKESRDLEKRYAAISTKIKQLRSPYFVDDFSFQAQGFRFNNLTAPIVKMAWAKGETLGRFVEDNFDKPAALENLRGALAGLAAYLESNDMAHGDIQPGNVMVSNQGRNVQLIDYDGMYVEALQAAGSAEAGMKNFQHPQRSNQWGPRLDRFSFIAIDLSLSILETNPEQWRKTASDADAFLFRANDIYNPDSSTLFRELRALAKHVGDIEKFVNICKASFDAVPSLADYRKGAYRPGPVPVTGTAVRGSYISPFPVLDAFDYAACLRHVGDKVELIGKIQEIKCDNTRYGKPYVFINFGKWDRKSKLVRLTIWDEGLRNFRARPDNSWIGKWVSVTGLIEPPFRKAGYESVSITIGHPSLIHEIDEYEAKYRQGKVKSGSNTALLGNMPKTVPKPAPPKPSTQPSGQATRPDNSGMLQRLKEEAERKAREERERRQRIVERIAQERRAREEAARKAQEEQRRKQEEILRQKEEREQREREAAERNKQAETARRMREELERRQRAQAASNTGCSVLLAIVVAILLIVMHH